MINELKNILLTINLPQKFHEYINTIFKNVNYSIFQNFKNYFYIYP